MGGKLSQETEELHRHIAGLARDLQNLQTSIQAARTIREGMGVPGHVWPDAPSFDPVEEQPVAWVAPEKADGPAEGPVVLEEEEQPRLFLQDYPTFPV